MKKMFLPVLVLIFLVQGSALAGTDSGAGSEGSPFFHSLQEFDAEGDSSMTTLFASDNNFAGNSFDIQTTVDVTIVGFDCNLGPDAPNYTVNVYWKDGTANGFEQTPTEWTLLGSSYVVGAGVDLPTHIDVGGLMISAGSTVGMIIQAEEAIGGTGGFYYTNGALGDTFTNGEMTITTYSGLSNEWPPGSVFAGREWNGTVHYDYVVALDKDTWGAIKAIF